MQKNNPDQRRAILSAGRAGIAGMRFLFLLMMISGSSFFLRGQSSLIAPDTVAYRDTIVFSLNYQGSISDPLFRWAVTDSASGYDSVRTTDDEPGLRYRITTDTEFRYAFDTPGTYRVTVQAADELLEKTVVVWGPQSSCGNIFDECETNLLNGSFEDFTGIPDCNGMIHLACHWRKAKVYSMKTGNLINHPWGSPDLWHVDAPPPSLMCNSFNIPNGSYAYQTCHNLMDNAFAGIFTWQRFGTSPTQPNQWMSGKYREYMQQELSEPLLPGRTYTITFVISLGEISTISTDLHVGFTTSPPRYKDDPIFGGTDMYGNLKLEVPSAQEGQLVTIHPPVNYHTWTAQSITFTYNGHYPANYMTIGNWLDDAECNPVTRQIPPPFILPYGTYGGNFAACYYLIDDIVLREVNNPCCNMDLVIDGREVPQLVSWHDFSSPAVQDILIEGILMIDENTVFNSKNIRMGKGARLIMGGNKTLTFSGTTVKACDVMWDGIYGSYGSNVVTINNSEIWDAVHGFDLKNGAQLNVQNSRFFNNYKSVSMTNYSGAWPVNIRSTTFDSKGLLPPYYAKKSMTHITVKHVMLASFNPPVSTQRNFFSNANTGIRSENSSLTVSNSGFANIRNFNYPFTTSAAVNVGAVHSKYTVISNSPGGANSFNACDNGILMKGALNAGISYNSFTNIAGTAVGGTDLFGGLPQNMIQVYENTIYDARNGIDLFNIKDTPAKIWNNRLVNGSGKVLSTGIRVSNPLQYVGGKRCPEYLDNYQVQVLDNRIEKFGKGIRTEFVKCLLVDGNDVRMRAGEDGQFTGISVRECRGSRVIENYVEGEVSDWRMLGIRMSNSVSSAVRCNTVNRTGAALMFDGNVDNHLLVVKNSMINSESGVYLNYGEIGSQVSIDHAQKNSWTGTFTNHFYSYASYGQLSKFYFVNGLQGSIYWPTGLTSIASFGYVPIPSPPPLGLYHPHSDMCYYLDQPGTGNPQPFNLEWDSLETIRYVDMVIANSTQPPAFETDVKELQQLHAYDKVKNNPWLMTKPSVVTFMSGMQGSNLAAIHKTLNMLGEGDLTVARQTLDSITGTTAAEDALVSGLGIELERQGRSEQTASLDALPEVAALYVLKTIADNCYYQYNEATLTGRIFLERLLEAEFLDECEYSGPREQPLMQSAVAPESTLFPNPASNEITVVLKEALQGLFELSDISGRSLIKVTLSDQHTNFQLPPLPDGIYVYRISDGDRVLTNGKLIIKK